MRGSLREMALAAGGREREEEDCKDRDEDSRDTTRSCHSFEGL